MSEKSAIDRIHNKARELGIDIYSEGGANALTHSTGSVLRIQWLDSAGGGGWKDADGFSGGIAKVLSCGIFVHEDVDQITICSSIANGPDGEHFMDPLSIPKCCIYKEEIITQNTEDSRD